MTIENNADAPAPPHEGKAAKIYRMLWRWHFYAGLLCIPFIIVLAISGSIYLFRPQVEAWLDRPYQNLTLTGPAAAPSAQAEAALAAVPGARFSSYVLPQHPADAVNVIVSKDGERVRVYLHPQTLEVLRVIRDEDRFMRIVRTIHGELLMGDRGSIVVEGAACWAIVMFLTGLYLWWPRNARGLGGVLYPRSGRLFWRDLHAVTGMWISFCALFLLLTGLPWTDVWGGAFKEARRLTGTAAVQQDWTLSRTGERAEVRAESAGDMHSGHDHGGHAHGGRQRGADAALPLLNAIVPIVRAQHLAPPVLISPPGRKSPDWTAKSDAQNRTLRADLVLDRATGALLDRTDFRERHIIDQVVGVGIAVHEGQMFGWLNQALGVLTAVCLVAISLSAFIMWRRRSPDGALGAPPAIPGSRAGAGLAVLIVLLAIFLPVFGATLVLVAVLEWAVLRRIPPLRRWLGLAAA